jgi:nucleotide-binding universal stress UspA family protein
MKEANTQVVARGSIVVGVDDSDAGRQAVDWGADQAALEGRGLVLVRATGSLGTAASTWLDSTDVVTTPVLQKLERDGLAVVSAAAARVRSRHPDLRVQLLVEPQDPAPELARLAEDAHLIVVGSSGSGLVRHLPTSQVGTTRVSRQVACPVVVVPQHDVESGRHGVLVGADLTEASESVLRFAYRQASFRGLPLTVTHFTREGRDGGAGDAQRLLSESVGGLAEEFPDIDVELVVVPGYPSDQLQRMSGSMHLLVIGQHHTLRPFESATGHVHPNIVDRATCPVAVVPQALPVATLQHG